MYKESIPHHWGLAVGAAAYIIKLNVMLIKKVLYFTKHEIFDSFVDRKYFDSIKNA